MISDNINLILGPSNVYIEDSDTVKSLKTAQDWENYSNLFLNICSLGMTHIIYNKDAFSDQILP